MTDISPATVSPPVIETERLVLRGHGLADFDACAALWADPDVTRFIGGRPFGRDEVWARLLRYVGHWVLLGYGFWTVREKATGAFVGELGLADFKRGLGEDFDGTPEMGWVLSPAFHGKGYACEAIAAVLAWSDANLPGGRTVCIIAPENAASIRAAERAGFRIFREATYHDAPTLILERKIPSP